VSARSEPQVNIEPLSADGESSKLTVLIIGPTPPPFNGMSVATELVLKALGSSVSTIHLDTADRRGLSNLGKLDLMNVVLALYHGLKYLWLLLFKRPKVVYVPIAQATLPFLRDCLFLVPARLLRKKLVVHLHGGHFGTFYQGASPAMRGIIRFALGRADLAIVLGSSLVGAFAGVIPADRIRVVPNGIPDHFQGLSKSAPSAGTGKILFLSTLMREKGTLDLLAAIPRVRERIPDVHVSFAGEWFRIEDRDAAQKLVTDLSLESCTRFLGPVAPPFKYDLLKDADLFVMPTRYKNEGHPYVILEAMSAGLPVISTNAGCISETVIDRVTGFVVEAGNTEALADKITVLLEDDVLRRKMAEASRKRFLEFYTFARFSRDMEGIFAELGS
jgi:glycosyltransferase involved in cell wall biosynthesis